MFKNRTLKTRIVAQFSLIVSPLALVILYQTAADVSRTWRLDRAARLQTTSAAVRANFGDFVNAVVDAVDAGRLAPKALTSLQNTQPPLQKLRAEEPARGLEETATQLDEIIALLSRDPSIKALMPLQKTINDLGKQFTAVNQAYAKKSEAEITAGIESANRQMILVSIAIALTLAMTIFFVRAMIKGLTEPLHLAESLAQQIASGRITKTIEVETGNDLGRLLDSLVTMNGSLFQLLSSVKVAAGNVSTSIDDIARSNDDLTRRAEQQSAFLKEAAEKMTELSAVVEQNRVSARQADDLAIGASAVAKAGGDKIAELDKSMESIQQSARKVEDIVGLINEIVFQTRMLACNATIEAARAGEAGRTFKVVADEVKKLAERVDAAAYDINALISDSVQRTALGATEVKDAASTIQDIVAATQRVTNFMAEITTASERQIRGIEQVTQVIQTIATMTQENGVVVEKTAAVSVDLRRQEEALAEAVSAFKLSDDEIAQSAIEPPSGSPAKKARIQTERNATKVASL